MTTLRTLSDNLRSRVDDMSRELKLFVLASLVVGMSYSLIDSTLNNYLNGRFSLTGFQRSFLEIPREIPGILVVFVSAALWFLCSRRLGAVSMLLGVVGSVLMGFATPTYAFLVAFLFIYSMGQHLFIPIASTIGMQLAREGKMGQRLGQLNAVRNAATIGGSFLVFLGFRYLHFTFQTTFVIAAVGFAIASLMMFSMQPEKSKEPKVFLKLHKEYRMYYLLAILYGTRKQIFITFAPWVIVSVLGKPTETLATLMTIGGIIGILFQPLLGWAIDRFGEKVVLAAEAVLLVGVCFGYGYATRLFEANIAFLAICAFYLIDQMLMSVNMARATYMKKIALKDADVQTALSAGLTADHVFSIAIALIGGVIWSQFGYQYVFLMGVFIAIISFGVALMIRMPGKTPASLETAVPQPVK